MRDEIRGYEVWRLEVPTGREFGDCKCHFNTMDLLLLALETSQGRVGWGFMQTMSRGTFTNSAPWVSPLPSLAQLQHDFASQFWPQLQGKNPLILKIQRPNLFSGYGGMKQAIRLALWDLAAQTAELPLYQFLGGSADRSRVRAYGSGIDFPLSDEDAAKLFRSFAERGFTAVKVKVGSPDPMRDLRRLQVVREAVGDQVEIAIDANEAWTCEEAIEQIRFFEICVHAAVALPQTDRMEISDVGWNVVPRRPVRIENGEAVAPSEIGHGLDPDAEQLQRYSQPEPDSY